MKRQLVAQVYDDRHQRRMREVAWYDIYIGGKRMVYCSCGGTVMDRPAALTYDEGWGGCSHIVALYRGRVTENKTRYNESKDRIFESNRLKLIRLTDRGRQMFHWRWTARALQST